MSHNYVYISSIYSFCPHLYAAFVFNIEIKNIFRLKYIIGNITLCNDFPYSACYVVVYKLLSIYMCNLYDYDLYVF